MGGGDVETREPQTRGLSVNSIADSLSLNFLAYFTFTFTFTLLSVKSFFYENKPKESWEMS